MPASSLYWFQKSASIVSSAAGNRSSAASPAERLPLASAVRMLPNSPAPTVPAPKAIVLPRKERRLIYLFRGLTLSSKLSSRVSAIFMAGSFTLGFHVEVVSNDAVDVFIAFIGQTVDTVASAAIALW